jgi:hypothetical protein
MSGATILNNSCPCNEELDTETKPAYVHKCLNASYIIKTAVILHGSAILVDILREVHYKG